MTPEGKVKSAVNRVLDKYTELYRFMPVQTGFGKRTLDYLLCYRGWFISIETKAPGHKPTGLQEQTIQEMRNAGAIVLVITTVEEAKTIIPQMLSSLPPRGATENAGSSFAAP